MKGIIAATAIGLFLIDAHCIADDYSMPRDSWGFMGGYNYDYPGCKVGWSERTGSFLSSGDQCAGVTAEKMRSDAFKSIEYVRKNSSAQSFYDYYNLVARAKAGYTRQKANQDAGQIWLSGCSDYKNGMNAGDFGGWLKLGDAVKAYPQIKSIAVNRLYMDGWNVALGLGGVIDCQEMAPYRSADYVSGVDVRKAK